MIKSWISQNHLLMRRNVTLHLCFHFLPAQSTESTVVEEDAQHPDSGTDRSMSRLEDAVSKSCSKGCLGAP